MRCERARDRIAMLIDGELPAKEQEAVASHAAECSECARYRNELMLLRRHLGQTREAAPAKLAARLSATLALEASSAAVVQPAQSSPGQNLADRIQRGLVPLTRLAAAVLI